MQTISENISLVREKIAAAARLSGRDTSAVTLVAVSKGVRVSLIEEAIAAGQRVFGENYVQEGAEKISALRKTGSCPADVSFHLIGHLQRNKVRRALELFRVIETVDRKELAEELSREAVRRHMTQRVLLQANISREPTKSGVLPEQAGPLAEYLLSLPGISLAGLMSIGTYAEPGSSLEVQRREFEEMTRLRDTLAQTLSCSMPELSMGMSSDFELAVACGATIVRVGTAIFGEREHRV